MNNIVYKRLEKELLLNFDIKLKSQIEKIYNIILKFILFIIIIFSLVSLIISNNIYAKLIWSVFLILFLMIFLNSNYKNSIITLFIVQRKILGFNKKNRNIELNKNKINIKDGNNLIINSYSNIREFIEYKNIFKVVYTPINRKMLVNQCILIPKEKISDYNQEKLFKEILISHVGENNFKILDENLDLNLNVSDKEFKKVKIYWSISIISVILIFILLFI